MISPLLLIVVYSQVPCQYETKIHRYLMHDMKINTGFTNLYLSPRSESRKQLNLIGRCHQLNTYVRLSRRGDTLTINHIHVIGLSFQHRKM